MKRPLRIGALAILGPGFLLAGDAGAQSVAVKPTQVHLTSAAPTALVALRNEGTRPARFQVSALSWEQNERGEMKLSPTKDVVFFPTFVVLAPGEEKKVRVGTSSPEPGKTEKTYRLYFEELPPTESEAEPGTVAVLTRLGVPVFVRPVDAAPKPVLEASAKKRAVHVTLANAGTAYFVPSRVAVHFLAADGSSVRERSLETWYVLAGGHRVWDVAITPDECKAAAGGVKVEAALGGDSLTKTLDRESVCGRE